MPIALASQRNFRLLVGGQFVCGLGGQVTGMALPAAVVLLLNATPLQVGALQAVGFGMIPLLAMAAGVIVDRCARRPLMIGANVARGTALIVLPVAYALHAFSLPLCFVVSIVTGAASVLFDTAAAPFIQSVVPRERIAKGAVQLQIGSSSAEAVGTTLAGLLIALVGAPFSIAFDALTHVVTTVALTSIHGSEPAPVRRPDGPHALRGELLAGIRILTASPVLRAIGITNAASHFGGAVVMSVFTVFLYRQLHLSPLVVGAVLGFANLGVGGAWAAGRIAERLGFRRTLMLAVALAGGANLLLPLFGTVWPIVTIVTMRLLLTLCGPIVEVSSQTIRLALVPPDLMGRASATNRTLVWGMLPLGALTGGYLGGAIGIVPTMLVGGVIALGAAVGMAGCPAVVIEATAATRACAEVLSTA